ncbi:MAG: putative sugar O-methyltransferase [Elusimicrobiota bacterium]|jgi:putative sugar O-methyltransferase
MKSDEMIQLRKTLALANAQPERSRFYSEHGLGQYWIDVLAANIPPLINDSDDPAAVLRRVETTGLYSVDHVEESIKLLAAERWRKIFQERGTPIGSLPPEIQESPFQRPETLLSVEGRAFSQDFLFKLYLACDVGKFCGEPPADAPLTLLEVGGGFGNQARILKLKYPACRYIIVDIPETLCFSYTFLRIHFPQARIVLPATKEELSRALQDTAVDFLLVPCFFSPYMDALPRKVDCAINTRSFGEMGNEMVRYYSHWLGNVVKAQRIVTLNRFLNDVDLADKPFRLKENGWFDRMGPDWKTLHWEYQPKFSSFIYGGQDPRELYFVGERGRDTERYELSEILRQCWYTHFGLEADFFGACELSFDTGKGGVLCTLSNSVRVSPNKQNVDAMIKYICVLEGKYPFEDRYYYMDLYEKITGTPHPLQRQMQRHAVKRFIKGALSGAQLLGGIRKVRKLLGA